MGRFKRCLIIMLTAILIVTSLPLNLIASENVKSIDINTVTDKGMEVGTEAEEESDQSETEHLVQTKSSVDMGFDTEFFLPATVGEPIGDAYLHTPYEDGSLGPEEELDLETFRMRQTRAAGDVIQIVKGNSISYNNWSTSQYSVLLNDTTYLGVCAEPSKASVSGHYTVAVLNDDVIKAMLYCFQDGTLRERVFGNTAYKYQFVNMHIAVGYRYSGDLKGAAQDTIDGAKMVVQSMQDDIINGPYADDLRRYTAYVAVTGKQDIVWLEKDPTVELTITKRSQTDLYSGDGYKLLSGAVFDLYAWDGSAYSAVVSTSVDNKNGTYTFKNIPRYSGVNGRFLIKERKVPEGYQSGYYFFNNADEQDYKLYGGRQFLLDENGEWSCYTLTDFTHPVWGFTFFNYPKKTTLTITKVDSVTNKKLTGAAFELWAYRGGNPEFTYKAGDFTDNRDGTYSITFPFDAATLLNGGYGYALKETKAPEGYMIEPSEWGVEGKFIGYDMYGNLITSSSELIISNTPGGAHFQLKKVSSMPELTDELDCYSLEGAEYSVYTDKNCRQFVTKVTTEKDGLSNTVSLPMGTYYVKETIAPKGFYKNGEVYKVTLTSAHSTRPYVLEVEDEPYVDSLDILLIKVDADTGWNEGQNGLSLGGARFIVRYYDVLDCEGDLAALGKNAKREWVFETDEDGFVDYIEDYLVDGDELYTCGNGDYGLPAGTITIQETKAPEGYHLDEKVYVIPIQYDIHNKTVISYSYPEIPNNSLKVNVLKTDSETGTPMEGTAFEHTKPNGTKESLYTDENGELSFAGLEWGTHTIREASVPDSALYYVNTNIIKFKVHENNEIEILSKAVESVVNGDITLAVNKSGDLDAIVENRQRPFTLRVYKQNNKGTKLSGAEFTLYSDKKCTDVVGVKETGSSSGGLFFSGLSVGKTYYLKETKAPKGYKLLEYGQVYEITSAILDGVFTFYINGEKYTEADTDSSENFYYSKVSSSKYVNMRVINTAGLLLPNTGSYMTIVLIGAGIVLMAGVLLFNKSNKKEK